MNGHALFKGEIVSKINCLNIKIFISRTTGQISNKRGTSIFEEWEFKFVPMIEYASFQGKIIGKYPKYS